MDSGAHAKAFVVSCVVVLVCLGIGFASGWYLRQPRTARELQDELAACRTEPKRITADVLNLNVDCGQTLGVVPVPRPKKRSEPDPSVVAENTDGHQRQQQQ